MSDSRAKGMMGGSKHKSKSKAKHHKGPVKHMHIRKTDNGGFIVQNDHEPTDPNDPSTAGQSEHALGDISQLHQALDEHMGDPSAAPPPAAAPPMAPPAAAAPPPTM